MSSSIKLVVAFSSLCHKSIIVLSPLKRAPSSSSCVRISVQNGLPWSDTFLDEPTTPSKTIGTRTRTEESINQHSLASLLVPMVLRLPRLLQLHSSLTARFPLPFRHNIFHSQQQRQLTRPLLLNFRCQGPIRWQGQATVHLASHLTTVSTRAHHRTASPPSSRTLLSSRKRLASTFRRSCLCLQQMPIGQALVLQMVGILCQTCLTVSPRGSSNLSAMIA